MPIDFKKHLKKNKPAPSADFEQDAATQSKGADLSQIVRSANELVSLAQEIEDLESALAEKRKTYFTKETEELPALMTAAGMKDFTLSSGAKIVIKPVVAASLPSATAITKAGPDDRGELEDRFNRG